VGGFCHFLSFFFFWCIASAKQFDSYLGCGSSDDDDDDEGGDPTVFTFTGLDLEGSDDSDGGDEEGANDNAPALAANPTPATKKKAAATASATVAGAAAALPEQPKKKKKQKTDLVKQSSAVSASGAAVPQPKLPSKKLKEKTKQQLSTLDVSDEETEFDDDSRRAARQAFVLNSMEYVVFFKKNVLS
jgi:hypothetical protein